MEITIRLPDEIGKQIHEIPNFEEFVTKVLREALEKQPVRETSSDSGPSKWDRISQRVQNDPVHPDGYSRQLKKGRSCTSSGEFGSYYIQNSPNLLVWLYQSKKEDL